MKTPATIADMPSAAFTALALLYVYFFADLAYPGIKTPAQRRKALRTLHAAGILNQVSEVEDADDAVAERYHQAIEDHVGNTFPDGWEPTHDYWGAKCIAFQPRWNAPKHDTLFAGDAMGRYMAFDSAAAIHEYTEENLPQAIQQAA
jgi:hypothetical protein